MSLAAWGEGGSRKPVIHRPWEARLRVLGVKSNAITIVAVGAGRNFWMRWL